MNLEKTGTLLLVLATVLVAASILAGGDAGKVLNGAAGLTWFVSAGLLSLTAARTHPGWELWIATVVLTGVVAFLAKPTDFIPAIVGFGVAGFVVAMIARTDTIRWARLVVALYLPFHIGAAVIKVVYRNLSDGEATIRSDPPPTAALVPIAMFGAAIAGALIAQAVMDRRRGNTIAGSQSRSA
jgi:hypothetical protein